MQARLLPVALISSLLLCGAIVSARGQDPTFRDRTLASAQISGQVRFADTKQPAYNVLVSCEADIGGLVGQVLTDRNGKFSFTNLALAQYHVTVRVPGYIEERQAVEVMTTSSAYVQFQLQPDKSAPAAAAANPNAAVVDANVPANARQEFDAASKALANGKKEGIEEAVRHLEKALTIYPRFSQASLMLGTAYMDLGERDKAERYLKQTLEINPQAANALFALGELYREQKQLDQAEKTLVQGLTIEPRSYQGHLNLARVYWDTAAQIKDDAQARPSLEKAYEEVKKSLELKADFAPAHVVKGNLLLRVRRVEDAQHEFEEYLRLDPKGPFAEQARTTVEKIKKALASQPPAKP
ncbi:MAG TPA: tetratricopeptide repeat protein [Pyrinomonadaceae bacterium]